MEKAAIYSFRSRVQKWHNGVPHIDGNLCSYFSLGNWVFFFMILRELLIGITAGYQEGHSRTFSLIAINLLNEAEAHCRSPALISRWVAQP